MRRGFGLLWVLVSATIIATVGVIAYQVGWSEGFAQHVPAAADGAPYAYPYYYGGPHFFGFGWIFGLLFFLFILFVFFRIARFAMFGRSRGGWGYGPGWQHHGGGVPPAIDERMREWHQKAHGEQSPPAPGSPPPPTPDQRSV